MNIKDRSGESFGGSIQQHGHLHLKTGDKSVAAAPGSVTGDGKIQGAPEIPSYKDATEVSQVEGELEPCTAVVAGEGGEEGEGAVYQGDQASKAQGVKSAPGLMRAHQTSSITARDHSESHGAVKCSPTQKSGESAGSTMPVVACPDNSGPARSR